MAAERRLASQAHFQVEWGGQAAFSQLHFAPFGPGGGEVELTRAVDGSRELFDWLQLGAKEKLGRTVTVTACGTTGEPIARYRLAGCRPLSLALSPMDALESGPLTETLTLSFEGVRMV